MGKRKARSKRSKATEAVTTTSGDVKLHVSRFKGISSESAISPPGERCGGSADGEACLRPDKSRGSGCGNLFDMLTSWQAQAAKRNAVEIKQEEYDGWRCHDPGFDTSGHGNKAVPSPELSDLLVNDAVDEETIN